MQEGSSNLLMVVLGVIVFAVISAVLYATFQPMVDGFFAEMATKMSNAWKTSK